MKSDPQIFGHSAEDLAEQYLRRKGYRIRGRNIRLPGGELDIVAQAKEVIIFVEVKARQTERYGGASYAVNGRKEQQIIKLAAQYMVQHKIHNQFCRFDVILCQGKSDEPMHIHHIENAFEVSGDDLRW